MKLEVAFIFQSMSCYQIIKLLCSILSSVYDFCVVDYKPIFHTVFFTGKYSKRLFMFIYLHSNYTSYNEGYTTKQKARFSV